MSVYTNWICVCVCVCVCVHELKWWVNIYCMQCITYIKGLSHLNCGSVCDCMHSTTLITPSLLHRLHSKLLNVSYWFKGWSFMCFLHAISIGQRSTNFPVWHFNTWQFHVYLATGHVQNISIPDSFMYTWLQVMYRTFQYLTVSCILGYR